MKPASHPPDGPRSRLRKHFGWTFTGNALYAGSRWLTFAALAKLITTNEVGHYALAIAIVVPVFALAGMNLRAIQSTDARAEIPFRDLAAMRLLTTVTAFAVCLALALFVPRFESVRDLIIIAALIQAVDAASDLVFGLFDHRERFELGAMSLALRGPLRLFALAVVLYGTRDLVLAMLAELTVNMLVLVLFDSVACRRLLRARSAENGRDDGLAPRWDRKILVRLLTLSLPMAGVLLIGSVQINLPRYFVEYFESSHELGLIAALSVLALAQAPIISALTQAALPKLAQHWEVRDRGAFFALLRTATRVAIALGCLGLALAVLAGDPILRLLYTSSYAEHSDLLVWLMASAILVSLANVYGVGITATRGFRVSLVSQAVAFALALPLYAVLTSSYGTTGAAMALLGHSLLSLLGYMLILHWMRFPR